MTRPESDLRSAERRFILTLSCPDRIGIVAGVANFLLANECNIADSAQFGDTPNQRFFMRVSFAPGAATELAALQRAFVPVGERFGMQWHLHDAAIKPRVLIMVSKFGHCLNDLLYRYRTGALPIEIPAIVSNHRDFYQLAASHDIPFHHLPVDAANKARQEERLLELIEERALRSRGAGALHADPLAARCAHGCASAPSTSIIRSCRAFRARGPTSRRTIAASS